MGMEHVLQKAIVQVMRLNGYFTINTDVFFCLSMAGNNLKKRVATINGLKSLGATIGTPDLIFLKKDEILFVEMKDGNKGKLSAEQKQVIKTLTEMNFNVQVWRSIEDCVAYLEWRNEK